MRLFQIIAFCLFFFSGFSQTVYENRYYTQPAPGSVTRVDPGYFNREYSYFASLPVRTRASAIERFTEGRALASDQIRQLAMLFPNDYEKSKYAGFAYRRGRIYDLQHFNEVAAVFTTQPARDAFYRFLSKKGTNFSGAAPANPQQGYSQKAPRPVQPPAAAAQNYSATPGGGAVTPEEFRQAKTTIQSKDFDSGKLEAAKQYFQDRAMSVAQAAEVMRLFIYDDNRLDFAKFALSRTTDKENAGRLQKELTLDANKSAFTKILDGQKISH